MSRRGGGVAAAWSRRGGGGTAAGALRALRWCVGVVAAAVMRGCVQEAHEGIQLLVLDVRAGIEAVLKGLVLVAYAVRNRDAGGAALAASPALHKGGPSDIAGVSHASANRHDLESGSDLPSSPPRWRAQRLQHAGGSAAPRRREPEGPPAGSSRERREAEALVLRNTGAKGSDMLPKRVRREGETVVLRLLLLLVLLLLLLLVLAGAVRKEEEKVLPGGGAPTYTS